MEINNKTENKKILIAIIFWVTIFANRVLSSVLAIFQVNRSEFSYLILISVMALLIFFIYFIDLIHSKTLYLTGCIWFLISILILFLLYTKRDLASKAYGVYALRVMPCGLLAIYLVKNDFIKYMRKTLDPIIYLITIGAFIAVITAMSNGLSAKSINFGGGNYQELGYLGSMNIGLLLFSLDDKYIYKVKFLNSLGYKIIKVIFMLENIAITIFAGGRGAFIVMVVFLIIYMLYVLFTRKMRYVKNSIIYILIFGLLIGVFLILLNNKQFVLGLQRILILFDSNNLYDGSISERRNYYSLAIHLIELKPIFGYGMLSSYELVGFYVHNIILEIMLEYGFFGLILFSIILSMLLYAFIKFRNTDSFYIIMLMFLASFISLMFSGSFLLDEIFIFSIIYILCELENNCIKNRCSNISYQ